MTATASAKNAPQEIREDRGLATAYERHSFYRLLEEWAARYEVHSAMEGPLDGIDGVPGVHGACLARRGVKVRSLVPTSASANTARAVYDATGGSEDAEVRVVSESTRLGDLAASDLVIAYQALPAIADWRSYVRGLAKLTRRVLVVTVDNPMNWVFQARRLTWRLRGSESPAPEACHTETLAQVLWEVGHVREHVYFDCPSWRRPAPFGRESQDRRFVYGPERWPYFGGPGWSDELLPALLRRPGFDGSETKLLPRLARMHAFVVDVRPRTPQARRRLLPMKSPRTPAPET